MCGCIIIPVDYHPPGVRHNVNEKTGTEITKGVTTRTDVYLRLGEPDFASEDGQRIGYSWTKVKMIIIWASYGGGGGGEEITRSYVLVISFASDLVSDLRLMKQWGPEVFPARELNESTAPLKR